MTNENETMNVLPREERRTLVGKIVKNIHHLVKDRETNRELCFALLDIAGDLFGTCLYETPDELKESMILEIMRRIIIIRDKVVHKTLLEEERCAVDVEQFDINLNKESQ